jgi:excinuclease ABC subunit B
LYADKRTDAIKDLLRITAAHREKQIAYNTANGIVPKSVKRAINDATYLFRASKAVNGGLKTVSAPDEGMLGKRELIAELTRDMLEAADRLEFERAAYLRDQIRKMGG